MKLATATWQEVGDFVNEPGDKVCLIPTGSLEQHGPHLPLLTDTILVTAAAEAAEALLPNHVVLCPTLWLGASAHHLGFPGTLTASFEGYQQALQDVLKSLAHHGFFKFYILNGHGGNTEPNGVVARDWRWKNPNHVIGHAGYFDSIPQEALDEMKGPFKEIRHACEAETSLMLHVRPDLVRMDRAINDGLRPEPRVRGLAWNFDETTELGVLGHAKLGDAAQGKKLFELAVSGVAKDLKSISDGVALIGD